MILYLIYFNCKKYSTYFLFSSSKTHAGCSWPSHWPPTSVSLEAGGKMGHCSGASQGVLLLTAGPHHDQLEKGRCSHTTRHSHIAAAGQLHLRWHGTFCCSKFGR